MADLPDVFAKGGLTVDAKTLIAAMDLSHARLLDELATIEKSGQEMPKVLAWRPGPGRAHLGWQFTHCAASHEKYLRGTFLEQPADEKLVADFAAKSVPSDSNVPSVGKIRELLDAKYGAMKSWVASQDSRGLARMVPAAGGKMRSVEETLMVLIWHEAHHHGQIHLTWNLYKVAHGLM
jgi:DinB family protein